MSRSLSDICSSSSVREARTRRHGSAMDETAWAEGLFRQRCRKGDKLWNFCVVYDSWVGTVDGSQGILHVLPALACIAKWWWQGDSRQEVQSMKQRNSPLLARWSAYQDAQPETPKVFSPEL